MTRKELRAAGFGVSEAAYERLATFVRALAEENKRRNLTAADEAALWRVHVCDSLTLLPRIVETGATTLLDLGAGGGLPGIPVACVHQELNVTLLDATRRKVTALERIIAQVGLANVHAAWGRAEAHGHDPAFREQFDAVTARAVATLPVLIEYAAGFVRVGGCCWFFKSGAAAEGEIAAADSAARACSLAYVDTMRYRLPGEPNERALIRYRKQTALSADLPRPAGRAKKRPL